MATTWRATAAAARPAPAGYRVPPQLADNGTGHKKQQHTALQTTHTFS